MMTHKTIKKNFILKMKRISLACENPHLRVLIMLSLLKKNLYLLLKATLDKFTSIIKLKVM